MDEVLQKFDEDFKEALEPALPGSQVREIAERLDAGVKSLPRRKFRSGDMDQSWAVACDGYPRKMGSYVMAKIVPRYQSGWEGCGIWLFSDLGNDSAAIATTMLADARAKIEADQNAVSFVKSSRA